jgi:uncharacterized LabA/DUF88 family protein
MTDVRATRRTAIMIDGGYYRKRSEALWGKKSAVEKAEELFEYCLKHITLPREPRDLYRIFYYDCQPMQREMVHPLTGEKTSFIETDSYKWTKEFYERLAKKRKVALRMGELAESQAAYVLKKEALADLLSKTRSIDDLAPFDFYIDVKQKGVDMRIGLDIASLAYGRYVDQVVLIAGDSDFVPVAKMARRNGIDFLLDPLKQFPKKLLLEHVDGIESFVE